MLLPARRLRTFCCAFPNIGRAHAHGRARRLAPDREIGSGRRCPDPSLRSLDRASVGRATTIETLSWEVPCGVFRPRIHQTSVADVAHSWAGCGEHGVAYIIR